MQAETQRKTTIIFLRTSIWKLTLTICTCNQICNNDTHIKAETDDPGTDCVSFIILHNPSPHWNEALDWGHWRTSELYSLSNWSNHWPPFIKAVKTAGLGKVTLPQTADETPNRHKRQGWEAFLPAQLGTVIQLHSTCTVRVSWRRRQVDLWSSSLLDERMCGLLFRIEWRVQLWGGDPSLQPEVSNIHLRPLFLSTC